MIRRPVTLVVETLLVNSPDGRVMLFMLWRGNVHRGASEENHRVFVVSTLDRPELDELDELDDASASVV